MNVDPGFEALYERESSRSTARRSCSVAQAADNALASFTT